MFRRTNTIAVSDESLSVKVAKLAKMREDNLAMAEYFLRRDSYDPVAANPHALLANNFQMQIDTLLYISTLRAL